MFQFVILSRRAARAVSKDLRAAPFHALLRLCHVESHTRFVYRVHNDLTRRVTEHQAGLIAGFTQTYHLKRLVYFEAYENVNDAIAREKQLKGWRRAKKVKLIEGLNPKWSDLSREMS